MDGDIFKRTFLKSKEQNEMNQKVEETTSQNEKEDDALDKEKLSLNIDFSQKDQKTDFIDEQDGNIIKKNKIKDLSEGITESKAFVMEMVSQEEIMRESTTAEKANAEDELVDTSEAEQSSEENFSVMEQFERETEIQEKVKLESGPLINTIKEIIESGNKQILEEFNGKIAYDDTKQQQIDQLFDELQKYRNNFFSKATRPLIAQIISLHDEIGKLFSLLKKKPYEELTVEKLFTIIEDLREDVLLILNQNDVYAYCETNDSFDPRRQSALRRVNTSNEQLAYKVAEYIYPGFEQNKEIIIKERVSLYIYRPDSTDKEADSQIKQERNISEILKNEKEG